MKFTIPILALAGSAVAAFTAIPTSTPASEVLSKTSGLPATLTGDAYTSLASALYSVKIKYLNADQYSTVLSDMYSAAAKASNSEKVVPSLVMSTWAWEKVTAAPWYDKNMPKDDKAYVSKYMSDYNEAYKKAVGDGDKGEKKSAAGRNGAFVLSVAAAVGAMVVMVAL